MAGLLDFIMGGSGQPAPAKQGGLLSPDTSPEAHRRYVIAQQEAGQPALNYNEWVKQQQPKK